MEETKAAANPPTATAAQTSAPPPQPPPTAREQPASKKRPLENGNDQVQNSPYFKMRLVLKDLRPHFVEVLRAPDFRNCEAAGEIKQKTKHLVELYKQMIASMETSNNESGGQTLQGETGMKQKPHEQQQVVRPAPAVSSKNKTFQSSGVTGKLQSEDGEAPGTYIVGGSAFGWNFITFTGNKPLYYGVTKESFRSAQASSGLGGV
ncbi:hypothetical protein F3Y22_tig00110570pilonHSYRG00117 [Hibiscus syriacus]|uniref:Uncharacterized protein n=1 Tax=Hibiscus syriacus TaxID=106335 RepID=A0A6A3A5V7_HIBSY|nr:uncharacterized protein LOC120132903 [Hibiscus syriacus]KAE8699734.1 hypothetical protein F3Y22_tig00110570pilonHSYRG00117 [Hibiscus syriacus]